jgi:short subunit dehydrogenase-like uncharacterized protein
MAPEEGFEPPTLRLTAACSTAELLRNWFWRRGPDSNRCTRLCRPLRSHSATAPLVAPARGTEALLPLRAEESRRWLPVGQAGDRDIAHAGTSPSSVIRMRVNSSIHTTSATTAATMTARLTHEDRYGEPIAATSRGSPTGVPLRSTGRAPPSLRHSGRAPPRSPPVSL